MTIAGPGITRLEVGTRHFDAATDILVSSYGAFRPRIMADPHEFHLRLATTVVDDVTLSRVHYGATVQAQTQPYVDALVVGRVLGGGWGLADRRDDLRLGPGDVACVRPDQPYTVLTKDVTFDAVSIAMPAVRQVADDLVGPSERALRFHSARPVSTAAASFWNASVRLVREAVERHEEVLFSPILRAEITRTLATAALSTFPNTALDVVPDSRSRSPLSDVSHGPLPRATTAIDANADDMTELDEIAVAARSGVPGWRAAFERHRSRSPLERLRITRLDRARKKLSEAHQARGGATMDGIAQR